VLSLECCRMFVCEICCRLNPECAIEPPYRESRGLWSKLFSHGSFPNTHTKCSVKCLRGDKLFLSQVFVVDLLCGLISSSLGLCYSSYPSSEGQ
jgi:hypothetical protein